MKASIRVACENKFASGARLWAEKLGHPLGFVLAAFSIVIWAVTGPGFGFSDSWQLIMNTVTSIVTFLAVFIIQNSQNRDSAAIQLKLDELIRAVHGAKNKMVGIEEQTHTDLQAMKRDYRKIAEEATE